MVNVSDRSFLLERIQVNPQLMVGKPTVRGVRLTVEHVLKALSAGLSYKELKDEYPFLEEEDIEACLLYAAKLVHEERVYDIKAA